MSLLDSMPHTATAYQRVRSNDDWIGSSDTPSLVFSDRACWKQPIKDRQIFEFGKRGHSVTHFVYFTADPELNEEHHLVIDGETFEVRSTPPDVSAGLGKLFRVTVESTSTGST